MGANTLDNVLCEYSILRVWVGRGKAARRASVRLNGKSSRCGLVLSSELDTRPGTCGTGTGEGYAVLFCAGIRLFGNIRNPEDQDGKRTSNIVNIGEQGGRNRVESSLTLLLSK